VKLYRDCIRKYMANSKPSFVSFEGFVDAMVLVDGLRKAGDTLTREKFIDAVETMRHSDIGLGSARLMYSPRHHKGFDHVYPTVVRAGKPKMITDWKSAVKRQ